MTRRRASAALLTLKYSIEHGFVTNWDDIGKARRKNVGKSSARDRPRKGPATRRRGRITTAGGTIKTSGKDPACWRVSQPTPLHASAHQVMRRELTRKGLRLPYTCGSVGGGAKWLLALTRWRRGGLLTEAIRGTVLTGLFFTP